MASRFWVGGTGNWDNATTTHWSASSGGAGGSSVPTSSDNVFFDANSGGGTVTPTVTTVCLDLDFNGYTGTLAAFSSNMTVSGSLDLGTTMTFSFNETFTFNASSGTKTIKSNGRSYSGNMVINASGATVQLSDDISFTGGTALSVTAGTVDFNGYNTTSTAQFSFSSGTTVDMSSSLFTFSGTGACWNCNSGATVNAGTSTIKYTNNSSTGKTFAGGGKTYNNFWFAPSSGNGPLTILASNTFNDFKDDGSVAHSILFTTGTTQTVSTFAVSGSSGNLITINSTTTGTHALTKSGGGTISCDYLNIQHSVATPSTTWYAGNNSTNNQATATAGSGWIFTSVPIAYTLTVTVGVFTLTGIDANVSFVRTLIASVGSFVLTGIDATITSARSLIAGVGAFVLTGINSNFSTSIHINVPNITLRNGSNPYSLVSNIPYVQTSPASNILPVNEQELSDNIIVRVYNNFELNSNIANALNVRVTTYDGAGSGSHTQSTTPVSQSWVHIWESGYGESKGTPGIYTANPGTDTSIGKSGYYQTEVSSDGVSNQSIIRAGADNNGLGFMELTTYAQVPPYQTFLGSSPLVGSYNFALSVYYEYAT